MPGRGHVTYAVPAGHALIGRALYLPADWAADDERRELAGVPDEVMFATKPELAGQLLKQAHDRGTRASLSPAMKSTAALTCARASANSAPATSWPSARTTW